MWRELRAHDAHATESDIAPRAKTFAGAAWAVALADVSMSLDNVLGVAGAARDHPTILVFGLVFSVAVMGLAARLIARVEIGRAQVCTPVPNARPVCRPRLAKNK